MNRKCPVCDKPTKYVKYYENYDEKSETESCPDGHYLRESDWGQTRVCVGDYEYIWNKNYVDEPAVEIRKAIAETRQRELTITDEERAFVMALKEDPYDTVARAIYADWLDDHDQPELADQHRQWTEKKQQAEDWLRSFSKMADISYSNCVAAGFMSEDRGDIFVQMGSESARDLIAYEEQLRKYWDNWEIVTGRKATNRERPFSCSC